MNYSASRDQEDYQLTDAACARPVAARTRARRLAKPPGALVLGQVLTSALQNALIL